MAPTPEPTKAELEAKRLLGRCPACGYDDQSTLDDEQYYLAKVDTPHQVGMPLRAVVCGNCGHVRLFHAEHPS